MLAVGLNLLVFWNRSLAILRFLLNIIKTVKNSRIAAAELPAQAHTARS